MPGLGSQFGKAPSDFHGRGLESVLEDFLRASTSRMSRPRPLDAFRLSVLGRDALRAYALVYGSLAMRQRGHGPTGALKALRDVLVQLPFGDGSPTTSGASSGYDACTDTLWIRVHQALGWGRPREDEDWDEVATGLETQELFFSAQAYAPTAPSVLR